MREESHLDDMRSAIRGDFERLAERLGGQELMRSSEDVLEDVREAEPEPEQVIDEGAVVEEPEPDFPPPMSSDEQGGGQTPDVSVPDMSALEEQGEPELEPAALPDATPAEEEPVQRSFWDRLLGR